MRKRCGDLCFVLADVSLGAGGSSLVPRSRKLNAPPPGRGPSGAGGEGSGDIGSMSTSAVSLVAGAEPLRGVARVSARMMLRPFGYAAARGEAQEPSCSRPPTRSLCVPGGCEQDCVARGPREG